MPFKAGPVGGYRRRFSRQLTVSQGFNNTPRYLRRRRIFTQDQRIILIRNGILYVPNSNHDVR